MKNRDRYEIDKVERDVFQELLECPDFYNSMDEFNKSIERINLAREKSKLSEEDKINIELAILLIKIIRFRTNLESKTALESLQRIASKVKGKPVLQVKYSIVRAEYLSVIKGDFASARKEFEQLIDKLRNSEYHLLYGLVAKALAVVYMMLGETTKAEEYGQDSISIFRRFDNILLYAYCLNNHGVLKKKLCQYSEAEKLLKRALALFKSKNAIEGEYSCYANMAIIKMKTGDLNAAEYYLTKSRHLAEKADIPGVRLFLNDINLEHLYLMRREHWKAEKLLLKSLHKYSQFNTLKQQALAHEFLGELYTESGDFEKAQAHLDEALEITRCIAPESDVMTEVKRRQAQLYLLEGNLTKAKETVLSCIRICKKINDKNELGAALRILGELYIASGEKRRVTSSFEASISVLKSIQESYELMRSCISYGEYLVNMKSSEADMYLLEAKQLCRKLEIGYYMSRIMILLGRYAMNSGKYSEARAYLRKAEVLCGDLESFDNKKVTRDIRMFHRELDRSILATSMNSAQKLKVLGKIYEEARFPIDELTPELALEVARNVGAVSLFLVKKQNSGYKLPLKYNISEKEAKLIVKRLDSGNARVLFGVKAPNIHNIGKGRKLVCVPGQSREGFLLCTIVESERNFSQRELEFLFASVEAMERLAEERFARCKNAEAAAFMPGDREITHPGGSFGRIITIDPEIIKLIRLAERAGKTDVPILLQGETGVGKELFARAIHESSSRKDRRFIAINTGGIPLNFLESELFGFVKGAYTDARMDKVGLVEEACGGTLFLDEVGEMSEELQVKLLRLLENGEYRRLGENKVRYADVRLISASNKNLEVLVKRGKFREDLYYRLSTVRFTIPALRYRRRDIELLVRHFLRESIIKLGKADCKIDIDVKAMEAFELYAWPGNIRELQNEILRLVSLIDEGELIRFGMLSDAIRNYFRAKSDEGLLERSVARYERRLILQALEENDWNRIRTAEQIGIPRTTLLAKMRRLQIMFP